MRGAIISSGYYFGSNYVFQRERLREEMLKKGIEPYMITTDQPFGSDTDFRFDYAVYTDKDTTIATLLESKGVRLFNSAKCIEITDSKGKTAAVLAKDPTIRQQKTFIRPQKYVYSPDEQFLKNVAAELGYPLVAKESRGSLGEQVYLIRDEKELFAIDEKMGLKEGIYQEYRKQSAGKSIRVLVVGGEALGAMELCSEGDFRSNAHQGGKGKTAVDKEEWLLVAEKAAKLLQADYVGIDLFYDEPVVIEANGNAFFGEFERVTGINVAEKYINYIIRSVQNDRTTH